MKKALPVRNNDQEGHDWLSEVISESTNDPRLNKKTPRNNRIWVLIGSRYIQGIGLALILDRRKTMGSRIAKTLNPKIAFQELKYVGEEPVCGYYDDFDDVISLQKMCEKLESSIDEESSNFWKTELGKKIYSTKTFWDSIALLLRRLQAI